MEMTVKCLVVAVMVLMCHQFGQIYGQDDNDLNAAKKDRYLLHDQCVSALQRQINEELYASLVYMNMAAHFDNNEVARKGFANFFLHSSKEEKEHAHKIIDYVNKRGGRVSAVNVNMPTKDRWDSGKEALEDALELEKVVNNKLHVIHDVAEHQCRDAILMDFLESEFLEEQVDSINQLKRLIAMLDKMDGGLGEYMLDRQILKGHIKPDEL